MYVNEHTRELMAPAGSGKEQALTVSSLLGCRKSPLQYCEYAHSNMFALQIPSHTSQKSYTLLLMPSYNLTTAAHRIC